MFECGNLEEVVREEAKKYAVEVLGVEFADLNPEQRRELLDLAANMLRSAEPIESPETVSPIEQPKTESS